MPTVRSTCGCCRMTKGRPRRPWSLSSFCFARRARNRLCAEREGPVNFVAIVNVSAAGTVVHYFAVADEGTRVLVARKIEIFVLCLAVVKTEISYERPLEAWELERMPR